MVRAIRIIKGEKELLTKSILIPSNYLLKTDKSKTSCFTLRLRESSTFVTLDTGAPGEIT